MPSGGWIEAGLATVAFLASHSLPPLFKLPIQRRTGPGGYLVLYSAVSIASLAWLGASLVNAPYVALWTPAPAAYWLPVAVMPLACVFIAAGVLRANPLSITSGPLPFDPDNPGILAWSRHPLLLGLALWGLAHLPPNGSLGEVLFFAGLGAFAGLGHAAADRRARRRFDTKVFFSLARRTSLIPASAVLRGRCPLAAAIPDWASLLGGTMLYAAFLALHPSIIGVVPYPP